MKNETVTYVLRYKNKEFSDVYHFKNGGRITSADDARRALREMKEANESTRSGLSEADAESNYKYWKEKYDNMQLVKITKIEETLTLED